MKIQTLLMCMMFIVLSNIPANSEILYDSNIILSGDWGVKEGEFGIEKEGKTELGYALDFIVTNYEILILDSINDRIQHFDLNGKYTSQTKLNKKWRENGLPWGFALNNKLYYLLIGKAPFYSPVGISEISQFDNDGKFNKAFGNNYISKSKEEYFNAIYSDSINNSIYCGVGGTLILKFNIQSGEMIPLISSNNKETIRLAGVTADGKPLINISKSGNKKTTIINPDNNKLISEIKGRFNLVDNRGRFISVHTSRGSNQNNLVTNIVIQNGIDNRTDKIEFKDDIKHSVNSKNRVYRYRGISFERSKIDSEGNIYHLIALEDGVVLRKISLK